MIITLYYPDEEIIAAALKLLPDDYPRERLEIVLQEAQDAINEGLKAITPSLGSITQGVGARGGGYCSPRYR